MKVISRFLREQQRYKKDELASIFECDDGNIELFLRILKAYNILKTVKNDVEQRDMTELVDEDVQIADETADNSEYLYVFVYVGVIAIGHRILKIYPKYLLSDDEPIDEMRQALKVLEKYGNSEEQIVNLYNGDGDNRTFNLLAVILFLLHDYYEYGLYSNTEDIIEVNGEGEILWEKTIDENFPLISSGRPYYMEMFTKKLEDDEEDYFRILHQIILTDCFRQLEESQLTELFEMEPLCLSEKNIDELGEQDYILNRIIGELSIQFNTRKQVLLKTLYAYISQRRRMLDVTDGISMFGTTAFNLVWEKVCADVFNNQLQSKLGTLAMPKQLAEGYSPGDKLIDIIDKPKWVGNDYVKTARDTFIPDIITFEDNLFIILDAKYYNLQMEKDKSLRGQPGIESITKQYLYQLAYREFVGKHGFTRVKNCFLLPTEKAEIVDKGYVELSILYSLGLENIAVRLLPAKRMFECYITGKKINIKKLSL